MTNRRELADRLERTALSFFDGRQRDDLTEAVRLLREPVAGEVEELRAVRDALLNAGGASPSDGCTRFAFWSLDKLGKAFDLAASSLRARLDDEGKGGDNGRGE